MTIPVVESEKVRILKPGDTRTVEDLALTPGDWIGINWVGGVDPQPVPIDQDLVLARAVTGFSRYPINFEVGRRKPSLVTSYGDRLYWAFVEDSPMRIFRAEERLALRRPNMRFEDGGLHFIPEENEFYVGYDLIYDLFKNTPGFEIYCKWFEEEYQRGLNR